MSMPLACHAGVAHACSRNGSLNVHPPKHDLISPSRDYLAAYRSSSTGYRPTGRSAAVTMFRGSHRSPALELDALPVGRATRVAGGTVLSL